MAIKPGALIRRFRRGNMVLRHKMEIKALICPQCQAQLEPTEQEKKEGYTACPNCGTVVRINEEQKVKYSVQVEHRLSNTQRADSNKMAAQRAFSGRNWDEAYDYYTQVLEDIPDDILSLYRKGMCAVHKSMYENLQRQEFTTNFSSARKLINKKLAGLSSETGEDRREKDNLKTMGRQVCEEVYDMLNKITSWPTLFAKGQDDIEQDEHKVAFWTDIARLYLTAAECVPHDDYEEIMQTVVNDVPETYEERILTDGIAFCKNVTDHKTDDDGNKKYTFHDFKIKDSQARTFNNIQAELEKKLRNLPTWIARRPQRIREKEDRIKEMEEEDKRLLAERKELDEAIEQFWANHPELAEQRKKGGNLKNYIHTKTGRLQMMFTFFLFSREPTAKSQSSSMFSWFFSLFSSDKHNVPQSSSLTTILFIIFIIIVGIACLRFIFFRGKKQNEKDAAKQEEFIQPDIPEEIKRMLKKRDNIDKKRADNATEFNKLKSELAAEKNEDKK